MKRHRGEGLTEAHGVLSMLWVSNNVSECAQLAVRLMIGWQLSGILLLRTSPAML